MRARLASAVLLTTVLTTSVLTTSGPAWGEDAPPSLSISPATGDTTTPDVELAAAAPCPAGSTDFYATIAGGGFPDGSFAIGDNALAQVGAPVSALLGSTWNDVASPQGATLPLNGLATVIFRCVDVNGFEVAMFTGQIQFTPATGQSATYAVVPGPAPTPTCPPGITDCPGLPTPTASPAPVAQPFVLTIPPDLNADALLLTVEAAPLTGFSPPTVKATAAGVFAEFIAPIAPVVLHDSRRGNYPWQVVGQLSGFVSDNGDAFPAIYAGWEPAVLTPGAGAAAGPVVVSKYPWGSGSAGLEVSRVLASATAGHNGATAATPITATLGGRLVVRIPREMTAGNYRATLTLTVMS